MATEQPGFKIGTLFAGADLRTHQFKFVKLNASGQVILCSVAGEKTIGVLQNKPNTGEVADIMPLGQSKLHCGAAVAAGAQIMTDASGRAITAATTGSTIQGWAFEAGAAAAEIVSGYVGVVGVV